MKTYIIRITFKWDDKNDSTLIKLEVPEHITLSNVIALLKSRHSYLQRKDKSALYENNGWNYESLLNHTCRKYGWKWDVLKEDAEIFLE